MCKAIIKKGDKYNRLIAVKFSHIKNRVVCWLFRCDCGKEKIINASNVKKSRTKSCGCLQKEKATKQGKLKKTHGMTKTKTYRSWRKMKERCLNKNDIGYKNYGGRKVKICNKWMMFKNFYKDMGDRPENKTLDRINNNGNYCKSNCKWSTPREQANNKRNNRLITFQGKTQNITQWAKELNIKRLTINHRLKIGWSIKKSLTNSLRR